MDGEIVRIERTQRGLSQARFSELCDIPQQLISAFELGKITLSDLHLKVITDTLNDDESISRIRNRAKRYRTHSHTTVRRADRSEQAKQTPRNLEYLAILAGLMSNAQANRTDSPGALSLFAGCGGLSLGLKSAGFQIKGYVEKDPLLRAIYRENFQGVDCVGQDISALTAENIRKWKERTGSVDLIAGGPPCQGFSLAGKRHVNDARNNLFQDYLRTVEIIQPRAAILENVRRLTSMKNKDGQLVKDLIIDGFRSLGYRVEAFEINAKDYGVPQHRERVVFVALRTDVDQSPTFPHKTHGCESDLFNNLQPYVTFADACSDLPYIESGGTSDDALHFAVAHPEHVIRWLWDVPQGKSAHDNSSPDDRPPSGYNTTYKRQVWHEPGGAVQTTFGMISGCRNVHPIATRSLTIREATRLQSFPDSFRFSGNLSTVRTGIGNAVPPLLAAAIGRHLLKMLR